MALISSKKIARIRSALTKKTTPKKYFIMTFGCQMNQADSEKIHMLLLQAGFQRVETWQEADVAIFNTCSVRQRGEDRVFGYMEEIDRFRKKTGRNIVIGITGCMTRKTGIHKKYYAYEGRKNTTKIQYLNFGEKGKEKKEKRKHTPIVVTPAKTGVYLGKTVMDSTSRSSMPKETRLAGMTGSLVEKNSLFNSDDALFIRTDLIDFVVRIEEIGALTMILSIIYGEDIGQDDSFQQYLKIAQARENPASASVIIQTGCDNYCTFCIVPYTRGKEISRPIVDIVGEVVESVEHGAKEVVLLGQNVNSYGKELKQNMWDAEEGKWKKIPLPVEVVPTGGGRVGKYSPSTRRGIVTPFRELLEQINVIPGLDRIRFTSSNPHDMTRDILDAHFDLKRCCHYLHFALQSGDNMILKKMNRKHTYEQFRDMALYLRSRDPLFGISTDIIVGFPGETEEQFERTLQAFRECQFDFAYIARYSPRNLTYAAKMPNQVPAEIKAERWDRLNSLMYEIIQARNQLMLGREEVILVSKIDTEDGTISGRTRNFKEVFLPKNPRIQLGDLIPVKITEIDRWVLRGKKV